VADAVPPQAPLQSPADAATAVDLRPVFEWEAAAQADEYRFELATHPDFGAGDIVISRIAPGTAFRPERDLNSLTTYYWRVTPVNQCGAGAAASGSFTTELAAGECRSTAREPTYFFDDMESGVNGWMHEAASGNDTWTQQSVEANSPVTSWHADSVNGISDQRLVSPAVAIPVEATKPTLEFFTDFDLEQDTESRCWDAGIVEYSIDEGQSWTPFGAADVLRNPYTGIINSGSSSPLGGLQGWCGVESWRKTVVDLRGLEGESVRFRFRLATDVAVVADDWLIDDVAVQSCEPEVLFADGFE
jgi:hypothetical protein